MTFNELRAKVNLAFCELSNSGLEHFGYNVLIELSLESYKQLLASDRYCAIRTEVDDPTERVLRGTIYGTQFVVTLDTDRVLIAKEAKE